MSGCPVGHGAGQGGYGAERPDGGPVLEGEGDTDYERYMNVATLLRLQKDPAELAHHDELMFQTIHQAWELWAKLWLHEMREVGKRLDADKLEEAHPLLERCTTIMQLQAQTLRTLNTMNPMDFHVIRARLGNGSGAESPGFRDILRFGPGFWSHVEALLERRGATVTGIYEDPTAHPDLLRLLESYTAVDEACHLWRQSHLVLVKRQIGGGVKSLKGLAVEQLEQDIQQFLWPELWRVRDAITKIAGTSPE